MSHSFNRIYSFSDTFGGNRNSDGTPQNLLERKDWDVLLETHFGSPTINDSVRERDDIYGLPVAYLQHIVHLAVKLQSNANPEAGRTGFFINAAPRTRGETPPFYVIDLVCAQNRTAIRAVTTSLDAFSPVRDHVGRVRKLPVQGGGLHEPGEQFRSRFTPELLSDHACERVALEECDLDCIPVENEGWRVGWVDSFGNVITRVVGAHAQNSVDDLLKRNGSLVTVKIGSKSIPVRIGGGLECSSPGDLTLYKNGAVDIVRRWGWGDDHTQLPPENHQTRILHSAYYALQQPQLGDKISVDSTE